MNKNIYFYLFKGFIDISKAKKKNCILKFLRITPAAVPKPDRTGATAS